MEKIIRIDYPTYTLEIPAIAVAKDRANYYAKVDGFEIDSAEYMEEIDYLLDDEDEAYDWLVNNTDPEDFKDVTKVIYKEVEVDWENWGEDVDAGFSIIEK